LRILKYVLNIGGLCWMIYLAFFSYALIVQIPDCDRVMSVIWDRVKELIFVYGLFLGLTAGLNLLLERKIEKRMTSKEYITILLIHVTFLVLGTIYASYEFYGYCGQD
jgi:hypothetical protein